MERECKKCSNIADKKNCDPCEREFCSKCGCNIKSYRYEYEDKVFCCEICMNLYKSGLKTAGKAKIIVIYDDGTWEFAKSTWNDKELRRLR